MISRLVNVKERAITRHQPRHFLTEGAALWRAMRRRPRSGGGPPPRPDTPKNP